MNIDYFMKEAIIEAKKAFNQNEVPVGGLIVENTANSIIARTHNKINKLNNSINHCEILLIFEACKKLNSKFLKNTTLFITLEPCIMCSAAIKEARIKRVYFSAYDNKFGGLEKLFSKFDSNSLPEVYGGIHENESSILLKKFFKEKRK